MTRSSGGVPQGAAVRREAGDQWEEAAQEVDPSTLLDRVLEAEDVSDERVEALLCGAVRQLRAMRSKPVPDSALYLTLCYLAKTRPLLFCTEIVVEAFCSLLRRDSQPTALGFKSKAGAASQVPVLAANLLLCVYHDETSWPDTFLKVFVEDSLGDRVWVDHDACKGFVDNILASFGTRMPPKSMMQQDVLSATGAAVAAVTKLVDPAAGATSSPSHLTSGDDASMDETLTTGAATVSETKEMLDNIAVMSRFAHNEQFVVQYVTDVINEALNRRTTASDVSRNLLKLMISTAGIPEVRLIIAQKLEVWIQNPKVREL
jgi:integrator complex subunit 1